MHFRSLLLTVLLLAGLAATVGAAPIHVETRLVLPQGRAIGPLETIQIVTKWDRAGYDFIIDFANLDGSTGTNLAVVDSANGAYLIVYRTGEMDGLRDLADLPIPIQANDLDDYSIATTTLEVCRRLQTPIPEHLSTILDAETNRFVPGDQLILRTRWRIAEAVPNMEIVADYTALVPDFLPTEVTIADTTYGSISDDFLEVEFTIGYKVPGELRVAPEANGIPLVLIARDEFCTEILAPVIRIDLRTSSPPSPIEHKVTSPVDRGIRDGDSVEILSRWDQGGYFLSADFALLDGNTGGTTAVIDSATIDTSAAGSYLIRYTPGPMEALPDAVVRIPIRAVDDFGDAFTDNGFTVCRNHRTPPPLHLETWIRDNKQKIRGGDSLIVYSRWSSPGGIGFDVEADYRNLIPTFVPSDARISRRGVDTFLVQFRVPSTGEIVPDGERIVLTVLAHDSLCSVVRYSDLFIDLDTTAPDVELTFDPLPAQTNTSPILLSGSAAGAAAVRIFNDRLVGVVPLDENDRFETWVDLDEGENVLTGFPQDDVGNSTTSGTRDTVLYVVRLDVDYPTPFRGGDTIVVQSEAGLREVSLTIHNLEGDVVWRDAIAQDGFSISFLWDGRDRNGDPAQPGYYLIRVRRVGTNGKAAEEILPLLVRDD